jgi:hypothetical protein
MVAIPKTDGTVIITTVIKASRTTILIINSDFKRPAEVVSETRLSSCKWWRDIIITIYET